MDLCTDIAISSQFPEVKKKIHHKKFIVINDDWLCKTFSPRYPVIIP